MGISEKYPFFDPKTNSFKHPEYTYDQTSEAYCIKKLP